MPRRSRSAESSSARRTAFSRTARSTSTPMTRWMPPCRSSPRFKCRPGAHLGRCCSKMPDSFRCSAGSRKYVHDGTRAYSAASATATMKPAFQYQARSISLFSLLLRRFLGGRRGWRLLHHEGPVHLVLHHPDADVVRDLQRQQVALHDRDLPDQAAVGDDLVALLQALEERLVRLLLSLLRP